MPYNKDIHHRRSLRLQHFDYTSAGVYFITICTNQRACIFGHMAAGATQPSDAGKIILSVWDEIPVHYPNVKTDGFVVMPNHIHGIIGINAPASPAIPPLVGTRFTLRVQGPLRGIAPKTIGEIVRAFKARCTHAINKSQSAQGISIWQRNYYEHIIRNENDLTAIREYITNNPLQWDLDTNNPHKTGSEDDNVWKS